MRARLRTLRWRVTLATAALGATLSILFAVAIWFTAEDYESILITEILRSEAQDYTLALASNADAPLPRSHRLSGYLRHKDGSGQVPPDLLPLRPGMYEEEVGLAGDVTIGVFDIAQGRLYFVVDLTDIEELEQHLIYILAAVIILGSALAAWLGWLLSGLSLQPVRRLAAAVDALPATPRATQLAAGATPDELGQLAAAIDQYQARLVEADAEERRFFADASHELRTPIAVVRGVTELILDDAGVSEQQRRWLERLDRGMAELTALLDVLLGLARGHELQFEDVNALELVAQSFASLDSAGALALDSSIDKLEQWHLPRDEARLVLQGVIRRLVGSQPSGRLEVAHANRQLSIAYQPDVAGAPLASARGDSGAAMTLVNRLAGVLGWTIEYTTGADGSRIALLSL